MVLSSDTNKGILIMQSRSFYLSLFCPLCFSLFFSLHLSLVATCSNKPGWAKTGSPQRALTGMNKGVKLAFPLLFFKIAQMHLEFHFLGLSGRQEATSGGQQSAPANREEITVLNVKETTNRAFTFLSAFILQVCFIVVSKQWSFLSMESPTKPCISHLPSQTELHSTVVQADAESSQT